jgi:hypothetical protein
MKMNYYADKWKLDLSRCPCDAHFNEWIDHKKLRNKTIFHFGSGNHHLVGTTGGTEKPYPLHHRLEGRI